MKHSIVLVLLASMFHVTVMASGSPTEVSTPEPAVEVEANVKTLVGQVTDAVTHEALPGVMLTVNGQKVYSDFDGNFVLTNLCQGVCVVGVSYISYEERCVVVDLRENESVEISLQQL